MVGRSPHDGTRNDVERAGDARRSVQFLALTFAITWSTWLPVAMASREWFDLGASYDALWLLGGFGPSVAAFILAGLAGGWIEVRALAARLFIWRAGPAEYAVSLLLIPALALLALTAHRMLGGSVPEDANLGSWYLLPGVLITSLLPGPISEEFGWRGYLLPRMQRTFGALAATFLIGLIWGLWHLPLFYITGVIQEGSSFMLFATLGVAFTIFFTWLYNRTSGSVSFAILLHASINSTFWLVPAADTRLHLIYIGIAFAVAAGMVIRGGLVPETD